MWLLPLYAAGAMFVEDIFYTFLTQAQARNKYYVDQLKLAPCMDCGQTFDPVCMDFDHVRGKKLMDPSRMRYKNYSLETIQEELDKCELVCACCHRLRTKRRAEERRSTQQSPP